MDVYVALNALRDVLINSSSLFMTGKNLVDKEEILELISEIEESLPKDIKEAKRVLDKRDTIIGDAKKKAEEIIGGAKKKAEEILSNVDRTMGIYIKESGITKQAQQHASDIVETAKKNAREMKTASVEYTDGMLIKLQSFLESTLEVIKANREELRN